jgi:hypothetical protein
MRDVLVSYHVTRTVAIPTPTHVSLVQQITQSIRVQAYHAKTSYCVYGALSTFGALRIYQITPRHTTLAREGVTIAAHTPQCLASPLTRSNADPKSNWYE